MYEDIFSEIEKSEGAGVRRKTANNSSRPVKAASKKQPAKSEKRNTGTSKPYSAEKKNDLNRQKRKSSTKSPDRKNYNDGYNFVAETESIKRVREKIRKTADKKAGKSVPSAKRRQILHIVFYGVIFAVVLAVGIILSLTVLFKSEQITVEGNTRYSTEDIAQASNIKLGENIFVTDKQTPAKAIVKEFPYVESADVRFVIPNTISISIKEAVPAYAVKLDDYYYLVSAKGRILEKTKTPPKNITLMSGSELTNLKEGEYVKFNNALALSILQDIMECVEANGFEKLSSVDVTNVARVKLVYDNRIIIKIGVPEDIDYKIRTAMKIIDEHLDPDGQNLIQGELDVSSCNTTKKSYFNEMVIETNNPTVTEPSSTAATTAEDTTEPDDNGDGDNNDDYYSGGDNSGDDGDNSDDTYEYGEDGNSDDNDYDSSQEGGDGYSDGDSGDASDNDDGYSGSESGEDYGYGDGT